MEKKYRFSRRIQLDKYLGETHKFESAEFSAETSSTEEAEKEVLNWIQDYILNKSFESQLVFQREPNSKTYVKRKSKN